MCIPPSPKSQIVAISPQITRVGLHRTDGVRATIHREKRLDYLHKHRAAAAGKAAAHISAVTSPHQLASCFEICASDDDDMELAAFSSQSLTSLGFPSTSKTLSDGEARPGQQSRIFQRMAFVTFFSAPFHSGRSEVWQKFLSC